ncbi:zinc-ribbon domain-containing protein [Paracoccus beibuensis]|uniref:zinc-ribbon domain-containing protein n=1 Tax=Paracoccus beibuensis TaxID=547602 RepID=UPI00223ECE64|nr:zinc-ribbon domain-containing protein [Paracoccus beibuensis]
MAEINLICPGCKAEYVLPFAALPPAGREVECSRCGLVWQAKRADVAEPLNLTSYTLAGKAPDPQPAVPQPAIPPASRRLAPEVLDILREEVEHERRLRAGEESMPQPAAVSQPEPDWPATTVVVPAGATRAVTANPQPQVPLTPAANASPVVLRHQPVSRPAPRPHQPGTMSRESIGRRPGRYALGFGLMVMLAVACLAIYLLAPQLDGQGAIGERLADLREGMDRIRLWLDSQAARLRG